MNDILEILKSNVKKDSHRGKAIFVFGPMGSGKTTYIINFIKKQYPNTTHLSVDSIFHLNYDRNLSIEGNYIESRNINNKFSNWLLENNYSFYTEGTGQNLDLIPWLNALKAKGYNIDMYFMETDLNTCLDRVHERNNKTKRKISDEKVIRAYNSLHGNKWGGSKKILEKYADISIYISLNRIPSTMLQTEDPLEISDNSLDENIHIHHNKDNTKK